MSPADPPRWDAEILEADRLEAIRIFREERLEEPLDQYLEAFDDYRLAVEELLEASVDLRRLIDEKIALLTDARLLEAVRYLTGPPISADDLKVVADVESLAPTRLRDDPDMAQKVIETIQIALDRQRFPWVIEEREPEPAERDAAVLATAALMATQRLSTARRSLSKKTQEGLVADALKGAGFNEVEPRPISTLSQAPAAGEFCAESMFGGRKADFVVGLWDERKLPLECKVSNSSLNSIKRLNNDAAVKAGAWIREFGTAQTVPGAVLSGVFKRQHLEAAQEAGLTLWWAHRLEAMLEWIESTRSS